MYPENMLDNMNIEHISIAHIACVRQGLGLG